MLEKPRAMITTSLG